MDPLRAHWDFDDLDTSGRRFRELLEAETDDAARAEILTQLARVHGLLGEFERGEELIREAERTTGGSAGAGIRIDLERGRLRRSSGDVEAALPLFESAFEKATAVGEPFLAVDAAHMAALASADREGFVAWSNRGIELAGSEDSSARYWLGPLLNNLGWEHFQEREYDAALDAFERALEARERDPENEAAIATARYAVGKALRALDRPAEAADQLERAVGWAQSAGKFDIWFHEELAECYAALGRTEDARDQARLALDLVPHTEADFEAGAPRARRLHELAGGS